MVEQTTCPLVPPKHAYLADQAVGYTPHQRLDTLLEADVLEESLDLSFRIKNTLPLARKQKQKRYGIPSGII